MKNFTHALEQLRRDPSGQHFDRYTVKRKFSDFVLTAKPTYWTLCLSFDGRAHRPRGGGPCNRDCTVRRLRCSASPRSKRGLPPGTEWHESIYTSEYYSGFIRALRILEVKRYFLRIRTYYQKENKEKFLDRGKEISVYPQLQDSCPRFSSAREFVPGVIYYRSESNGLPSETEFVFYCNFQRLTAGV